jgi:pyridoxine 5-phosphate synthase
MAELGVNIDHVATLREARRIDYPDPVHAAVICQMAGCDSIVAHLREDRRHIKERDIELIKKSIHIKFNMEMSIEPDIVKIAVKVKPDEATLVPERREEITTEGGLDVIANEERLKNVIKELKSKSIEISLFIDPVKEQIEKAKEIGAEFIELHTGRYANAKNEKDKEKELKAIKDMTEYAKSIGLRVNAGHGLNYRNVKPIAEIQEIETLNIGHSIIARAVFVGLEQAVREMIELIR